MSKDLEFTDKRQFQLIMEKLKTLVSQFEAEDPNTLNIKDLNQNQILQAVAEKRLEQYPTKREAAESLGIDIRTLKKYAAHNENNDG